jgi:hypothetical protein
MYGEKKPQTERGSKPNTGSRYYITTTQPYVYLKTVDYWNLTTALWQVDASIWRAISDFTLTNNLDHKKETENNSETLKILVEPGRLAPAWDPHSDSESVVSMTVKNKVGADANDARVIL